MDHIVLAINGLVVYEAGATPVPAPVPNPFIKWHADGRDLMWIQTWGQQHAITEDQWPLAIAAGYTRPDGPSPTPHDDRTGFDLTPTLGGEIKENPLEPNVVYPFTFVAPSDGRYYFQFSVEAGGGDVKMMNLDGAGWQNVAMWTVRPFTAVAGQSLTFTVEIDGHALVGVSARHG